MTPVSTGNTDDSETSRGEIVEFPKPPEEQKAQRVRTEAERLSRLAEVDWQYQIKGRAKHFDVEPSVLKNMVVALVRERENKNKKGKR